MKYTIDQDRLQKVFNRYMDEQINIGYDETEREFYYKENTEEVFGYTGSFSRNINKFYYTDDEVRSKIEGLFGGITTSSELLINYLNQKFPELNINSIDLF